MRNAFNKEVIRSITHSLGRFLAIAVIAALGTGFYAGLRMTAPDMKLAADEYYDGTNFCDVRVVGTLGLTDDEIEQLRGVEGVEGVMPAYEADVLAVIEDTQYTMRVHSLDVAAAEASDTSDGINAVSGDADYINRPLLVEGSWPKNSGECVLGADAVMDGEVEIGDTVTVVEGTQDLDQTFDVTEYTVAGFVRSSYYASTSSLGSTSLGNGSISQYMFVPEGDFAADSPYTEAFVTVEGAKDLNSSSEAYDELVAQVVSRIENISETLNAQRLDDIRSEAQETLDESRAEYESEKADAEAQLADGQAELDEAASALDDAESQLADAHGQLADAQGQLSDAAAQLDEAQGQIASSKQQLEKAQSEYDAGAAELAAQRESVQAQLDAAQAQIDEGRAALEKGVANLDALKSGLAQAQAGVAQLQASIDAIDVQLSALDPDGNEYAALAAQRDQLASQLAQAQAQADGLSGQISQIESGIAQLDAAQSELDAQRDQAASQLDAAQAQLDAAKAQLDDGWAQLAAGERDYQDGLAEYEAGLSDYRQGVSDYEQGESELAQGKADYADGLADYEEGKAEAEESLADAEVQLADAQAQINDIAEPELYVLDRSKNMGAESFESDANRVGKIAQVFPFIFFLVAALVSLTTMTRMVEEERVLIGTFKALGYSNARITSKYLVYAIVASGVGSLVGIVALSLFLPYFIMEAYSIVYAVPPRPTPIDPGLACLSAGLGIGITVAATCFAAASTLRERPAALMLPRTPKAGKRILLERIRPVWRRMSFSWKVTARNIFRYKRRFFMAIIGIAGCTALLLTGLGLQNAINDIIDKQFGEIYHYSMSVRTDDDISADDEQAVQDILDDPSLVSDHARVHTANMVARAEGEADQRLELVVPQSPDTFGEYVTMRERVGHAPLPLEGDGAIISEKLATELGLKVGDAISLYEEDSIGNATGDAHEVRVSGIMENYVSQYAFMSPAAYKTAFGEELAYTTVYAKATDDAQARSQMSEALLDIDGVTTVGFNDDTVDTYRTMLSSVDSVVVILVIAAAALAFVVLYNLTNINITERQREIATLKVLGFTPHEVSAYIYRETILLSVIGALAGLALGIWMEGFVVTTAEVDQVMFGREVHLASFAIAFALTMAFSVIVTIAMRRKLAKIDMVESLKSVE